MFVLIPLIMGPIILILAAASPNDPSVGFWLVVGTILTLIDVAIIIWLVKDAIEKKKDPEAYKKKAEANYSSSSYSSSNYSSSVYGSSYLSTSTSNEEKPASVIKRGVAGTIIGGVPGAVIGAASAINKNNTSSTASNTLQNDKPASVVKRGVAGTIIGGVPGAVIGVASAIDKNNRINKQKK